VPNRRILGLAGALLLASVVGLRAARADGPMFVWADKDGNLHATDRLSDVPEPYYAVYAERLRELEKEGHLPKEEAAPAAPAYTPPRPVTVRGNTEPPITAETEILKRKKWRELMTHWRQELATATTELQKVEQEASETGMNPLLRLTPQVQAQLDAIGPRRDAARARVLKARTMLLEVLPKRARDERVPPQWLL
jgi:hypothetical protein